MFLLSDSSMPALSELTACLNRLAPRGLAESWDNVGLLLGDPAWSVERVMTCLTLTPDVAAEAIAAGANLVVTHHPVLFKPVQKLTAETAEGRMLLELAMARVAVYSPHTGYDSAPLGINQQLAEALKLTDIGPLRPTPAEPKYQIVVFVPRTDLEAVQQALWRAGAGQIGDYGECSFYIPGTGTFRGSATTHPKIGTAGHLEHVDEIRLEVLCEQRVLADAIRELVAAHPYEEPAYFIYPLKIDASSSGSGRCGGLPTTEGGNLSTLSDLLAQVKLALGVTQLQHTGALDQPVTRVGVACGAGGDFLGDARRLKCDAFVTGEARFHTLLEARSHGIALIVAGHFATEQPAMRRLAAMLSTEFPAVKCWTSEAETDPLLWA